MKTILLLLPGLLAACQLPAAVEPPVAAMDMRMWDLPPGQAKPLAASLRTLLGRKAGPGMGNAMVGPEGALVVVAPRGVLDRVDELVARSIAASATAGEPVTVTMRYWLVHGVASEVPIVDEDLAVVARILDPVAIRHGPQHLSLQATRTVRSRVGEEGSVRHPTFEMHHVVTVQGERVNADLDIMFPKPEGPGAAWPSGRDDRVSTRIAVDDGQIFAVGHAGADDDHWYVLVQPTVD